MKKFKKLIPALCMLLISAVLMGTSTYAWFSMNESVKAEGMQVTAKSNSTYLLITDTKDATGKTPGDATLGLTKDFSGVTDSKVYPVAKADATVAGKVDSLSEGDWYTCNNGDQNTATGKETNYKKTTLADGDYFKLFTVYLTLSKDSEAWDGVYKVTVKKTSGDDSVSCVVKIGAEELNFTGDALTTAQTTKTKSNLSNTTQVPVEIYVYINGTSTNVNSNYFNANGLNGTLEVQIELAQAA